MVSHIHLLVELGPICNSMAASLCLKSCEDHSVLKSYNGGLWKNYYKSGPNTLYVRSIFEQDVDPKQKCFPGERECVNENYPDSKWVPCYRLNST